MCCRSGSGSWRCRKCLNCPRQPWFSLPEWLAQNLSFFVDKRHPRKAHPSETAVMMRKDWGGAQHPGDPLVILNFILPSAAQLPAPPSLAPTPHTQGPQGGCVWDQQALNGKEEGRGQHGLIAGGHGAGLRGPSQVLWGGSKEAQGPCSPAHPSEKGILRRDRFKRLWGEGRRFFFFSKTFFLNV